MLFVRSVSTLINKAVALCDKAIATAQGQADKAREKTEALQTQIREQGAIIDTANKEKAVAEALKAKLNDFTTEAARNAE